MSATYDPALISALDWVRFLIGDTNVDSPYFQDEEIEALLGVTHPGFASGRYCVAAQLLETLRNRSLAGGGPVVEKVVGNLRIRREQGQSADAAMNGQIAALRARCANGLLTGPNQLLFKVL